MDASVSGASGAVVMNVPSLRENIARIANTPSKEPVQPPQPASEKTEGIDVTA